MPQVLLYTRVLISDKKERGARPFVKVKQREIICVINWVNKRSGIIICVTEGSPRPRVNAFGLFCLNGRPRAEQNVNRSR